MSRIGKMPVKIPTEAKVSLVDQEIKILGPKGELKFLLPPQIKAKIDKEEIVLKAPDKKASALYGLTRTRLANAITGVCQGWSKTLELVGVGFRAVVAGDELVLNVGFSHPVKVKAPFGIAFSVSENKITVFGPDKELVGEVAAGLRRIRPPEPYKGKGVRYEGEKIRRKIGKAAKAVGLTTGGKT